MSEPELDDSEIIASIKANSHKQIDWNNMNENYKHGLLGLCDCDLGCECICEHCSEGKGPCLCEKDEEYRYKFFS